MQSNKEKTIESWIAMFKKIASTLLAVLFITTIFAGCGGSSKAKPTGPDKEAIPLPEYMWPQDSKFHFDDNNKSSVYFEADMTLSQVKEFYKEAFAKLEVYEEVELTEAELKEKKIVPEAETDGLGKIVWAYYGKYKLAGDPEVDPDGTTEGFAFVICSQEGSKVGVEVAIAYRAVNIAEKFGFNPLNKEIKEAEVKK